MRRFAEVADAIARQSSTREKCALLATYLRSLDAPNLEAATRFFSGSPFAARDQHRLGIGGRTVARVAERLWGFTDSELTRAYRESGDLGSALGSLVRAPLRPMLFGDTLSPATLKARFDDIVQLQGKHAGRRREAVLESILRACRDALETTYVVKIITGDLRIGLREGLLHDAIAAAFDVPREAVHRVAMVGGDIGTVAVSASRHTFNAMGVAYGTPVGFMLASPIAYAQTYDAVLDGEWIVEDKYDGIRAQAHVGDGRVRLFSRTLNDVTSSYPELSAELAGRAERCIIDGEIIAERDGSVLPFRMLQSRLQRKTIDPALMREIPVTFMAFDLIAYDDMLLLDRPLHERRARLQALSIENAHVQIAPHERIFIRNGLDVNERFDAARARGHEGLVFKRVDSPYLAGRRGKWWLKLKQELATLDVVVVAVEWGNGKRASVLSDYTFAVRASDDRLLTIGKAYSGLTDAEIAALTPWFLQHQTGRRGHAIAVEPQIVLEVAFDVVQPSTLHESGYSLRFPRIVRIRDDKPPSEIDTLARVDDIYNAMLARENSLRP